MIWGGTDIIKIEIKCTISKTYLNHSETIALHPWENCLPWSQSLVQKCGDHCFLYMMKHERDNCVNLNNVITVRILNSLKRLKQKVNFYCLLEYKITCLSSSGDMIWLSIRMVVVFVRTSLLYTQMMDKIALMVG